jgi:hypothetical protein
MNECEYAASMEWCWWENRTTQRDTCPNTTLSTTIAVLTGLESNLDLYGGKSVTNPSELYTILCICGHEFCFGNWNGNVSIDSVSLPPSVRVWILVWHLNSAADAQVITYSLLNLPVLWEWNMPVGCINQLFTCTSAFAFSCVRICNFIHFKNSIWVWDLNFFF